MLIVADDPLARAGLAALLSEDPGCVVTGQAAGEDAAALLEAARPDVMLCDTGWEGHTEALSALRSAAGDLDGAFLPLVALLPHIGLAAEAWSLGARGLLPRDVTPARLVAVLSAAANGLAALEPAFASALLAGSPGSAPLPAADDVTPREKDVLSLLAEGLPNKAIALRLGISEHTVKFHINALMSKLGAQSRTDAVVRATRQGILIL